MLLIISKDDVRMPGLKIYVVFMLKLKIRVLILYDVD